MIEFLEEDTIYLNEKFAAGVIPNNLEAIARTSGIEMFTSQQLKQEFINILQTNKKIVNVKDQLIKLVEKNDLIPCYTSSNLIDFYTKKIWRSFADAISHPGHPAVAFYSPKTKKIFVLFEYQVGYLLNFDESKLIDVILHEIQHYCAAKLGMKHFDLFQKVYVKWFQSFFQVYLSKVKISEKLVSPLPLYLYQTTELTNKMFASETYWKKYQDIVFNIFDQLGEKRDLAKGIFDYIIDFYSDPNCIKLTKLLKEKKSPYLEIYLSMFEAYSKIGYKKVYTFPGQELIYVSEIACMTSTNPLDDSVFPVVHQSAINALSTI